MPLNDFGTPPRTAASSRCRSVALCFALLVLAAPLAAQVAPSFGEDAATVPGGMLRLRLLPTWTRVADRWMVRDGQRQLIPLGGELASDSLGIAQLGSRIPELAVAEGLMRELSGDAGVRLTLGRSVAAASTRRLVIPIGLEYGVTSRLTLGVTVPIVQTRTRFSFALNNDSVPILRRPPYNVGPNPGAANTGGSDNFYARNGRVVEGLTTLATNLGARIDSCRATPTAAGCEIVLRDETQIVALIARANAAASSIRALYGVSAQDPGLPFVPLSASAAQAAINSTLNVIIAAAAIYGVESDVDVFSLGAARGPAGFGLLDSLYRAANYDSLGQSSRIGVGDIEFGAKLLVLDTHREGAARGVRLAIAALLRLGTGQVSLESPYGEGTGDGQMDIGGAAFLDATLSRWLALTLGARYTAQTGETEAWFPDADGEVDVLAPALSRATLGNVISLEVTPRFRVSRFFSLDARYDLSQRGGATFTAVAPPAGSDVIPPPVTVPSTTVHAAGFGVTYSTLENWSSGTARLPLDVLFTHLQTIASSGGPAFKTSHTQIQLRLYYRLFGR